MPSFFCGRFSTVCASHILVPTELEAIKLKNEIKSFDDFKEMAGLYSKCPSGKMAEIWDVLEKARW